MSQQLAAAQIRIAPILLVDPDDVNDRAFGLAKGLEHVAHRRNRRGGAGDRERAVIKDVLLSVDDDERGGIELEIGLGVAQTDAEPAGSDGFSTPARVIRG